MADSNDIKSSRRGIPWRFVGWGGAALLLLLPPSRERSLDPF